MDLPVIPPVLPMLAKSVAAIPAGMQYEAKWDGFRAIVFRDGDEVELGSRTGKPLTRYFPELVTAVRERLPERCVVDGEIVIAREGHLDFDTLTERIHPADSRVRMLAERTASLTRRLRSAGAGGRVADGRPDDRPAGAAGRGAVGGDGAGAPCAG